MHSFCPASLQLPLGPQTHHLRLLLCQARFIYGVAVQGTASQQGCSPASDSSFLGIFQVPSPQGNHSFSLQRNGPHRHWERARAQDL